MLVLDPVVHAALVTVFTWLATLLFQAIGLNFGPEVVTGLVTVIVGYILSLFGYSLWSRATGSSRGLTDENSRYVPPFTR